MEHALDHEAARERRIGLAYGFGAYGVWGLLFPLHLRALNVTAGEDVSGDGAWWAGEVLAHRVAWALVLCILMVLWLGRRRALWEVLRRPKSVGMLAITAALVSVNWLIFIYALASGELYRASIGYFVTPMVQIALGMIFLGERLRAGQWVAIGLAGLGMLWLLFVAGGVPWNELTLAGTFGLYGLLRKRADAGPMVGLTIETACLLPFAIGYLVWVVLFLERGSALGSVGFLPTVLLFALGVSTALPLLWFAAAAKRLPLATIGFLQFGAPTGQFLLGVLAFGETVKDPLMWWGYALIWLGVSVVCFELVRQARRRRRLAQSSDSA